MLIAQSVSFNDPQLVKTSSYIDGQWRDSHDKYFVINPFDGSSVAEVSNATPAEATSAIEAAKLALPSWANLSASARGKMLRNWYELLLENQDDLAKLLTLEQGKPLAEAKGEIAYGASYIEWFAEEGKRVYGDTIPAPSSDKRVMVVKQPVGVVTAITPWNFPNAMIARKAAAALAAGCTFVVRPSELTPLSALALAELADRAGIPKGVFNVIVATDAQAVGEVLTTHPDVAKFTFTGSTRVGKILTAQCAASVKKVSMELGGNAPFIVFDDADLDAAVSGFMASKFRNAGQTCVCSNRLFVHKNIEQAFTEKLLVAVNQLRQGDGLAPETTIGPLINEQAVQKVSELVNDALNNGAEALTPEIDTNALSRFYPPTVLRKIKNEMKIAQNEIFGPVAPIISFETEEEVIAQANNTDFGLAAYFYSRDIGRIWRVSEALQFGMVGINEGIISNPAAPFGGVKQSGNGREGSKYGLEDYMEIKYLCFGGLSN